MKTRHWLVLLVLSLSAVSPVRAAVHIWTGASSSLFSDGSNWRGGSPAGDAAAELAFPAGAVRLAVTNDVPGLTIRSVAFSGSGYSIGGQALTLVSGAQIIDSTEGPNEVSCDVHLSGATTLHRQGTIYQDAALVLSGAIAGTGSVVKIGSGRTIFSGGRANTYTGGTQVLNGELRLAKADGVNAVPGDLLIGATGLNDERSQVTTVASEQIADTATIRIADGSSLGVGRTETVGPFEVQGGARVSTSIPFSGVASDEGTLILRGDVTILPGVNEASFDGDLALDGNPTFTSCDTCTLTRFSFLRDYAPGAGLVLRGGKLDISHSSYHGPTVIDGASATIDNLNTAVRMIDGRFSGHVASLVTEGGTVDASAFRGVTTVGDLRLGAWTKVLLFLGAQGPRLIAGGTLDPGHAELLFFAEGSVTRIPGNSYVVALNGGSGPMRTFDHLPEGAVISDRFRISYTGGDGNDLMVTEVGRFATSTSLAADPAFPDAGQSVTLTATVSSFAAPIGLPSQVTFRDGTTIVGSAPLNAGLTASLVLQPSPGAHTYTATFSGTSALQPSTSDPVRVTVRPVAATLTSVEPATITAGTTVTLTLRGTGFLPGGYISVSADSTLLTSTFLSPFEAHATWAVPASQTGYPVVIAYEQPIGTRSNSLTVQVVAPPKTVLTFEPRAIAGPVAVGGGAAWLSIARRSRPEGPVIEHRSAVTPDADRDGIARWEQPDDVPATGLWLMADMLDGKVWSGRPDGSAPPARPLPSAMFLRDPDGHYTHVIFSRFERWTLLWARPGVGAWTLFGGDGHPIDRDGGFNGRWVLNTSQMQPVGNSPAAPPAGVEAGDTWLAMSEDFETWAGDRVDAHLGEASGPGTLSVALGSTTLGVAESAGTARLNVLRTGGTDGQVSIDYKTVDSTATAGLQYEARAGRLTFGPGEILKTIEVPIVNDSAYAASAIFRIVLSEPAGTTVTGLTTIDVVIQDDDPPPQLSMSESVSVTEGDDGRREATFTVTITGTVRFPVTVPWGYELISDRASGEPFSPGAFGTLTFVPGGPRSQTIPVRYDANQIPQGDRVFRIVINNVTNALPSHIERFLTLVDDDFAEIIILDASVSEAQDRVRVTIAATRRSYKQLGVRYTTVSGSAIEGSDFTATTGTTDYQLTQGRYVVDIPIVADSAAEGDEFFTVVLSDAKNARIRRDTATVVIVDDESGALPAITGASMVLTESSSTVARFRFGLSFPVAREVRFHVTTVAGSATAGEDFVAVSQTVVFPAGSTEVFLTVPVVNDLLNESTETFSLQLSEPDGATIATPTLTVTLFDQEVVEIAPNAVRIGVGNLAVLERDTGVTPVRFTVRLSRASNVPITVAYATADGSAVAPADYTAAAGTLTFNIGETEKTVDVAVAGDQEYEADETFTLVLGNPTNVVIDRAAATCRVLDDEPPPVHRRSAGR